jgi:hypothetical protein
MWDPCQWPKQRCEPPANDGLTFSLDTSRGGGGAYGEAECGAAHAAVGPEGFDPYHVLRVHASATDHEIAESVERFSALLAGVAGAHAQQRREEIGKARSIVGDGSSKRQHYDAHVASQPRIAHAALHSPPLSGLKPRDWIAWEDCVRPIYAEIQAKAANDEKTHKASVFG